MVLDADLLHASCSAPGDRLKRLSNNLANRCRRTGRSTAPNWAHWSFTMASSSKKLDSIMWPLDLKGRFRSGPGRRGRSSSTPRSWIRDGHAGIMR